MFLAIVCLAIIAAISGSLIHVVHSQRQQIRLEECKLQADWLAEAGLERARAKLVGSPDYSGETWSIAASELAGRFGATVNITVEDVADQPAQRLVRVQADFPADSHGRARHGKQAVIQITKRTGE